MIEVLDNRLQEEKWEKNGFIYLFIGLFAVLHGLRDHSSMTGNGTHTSCVGSVESTTRVLGKQSLQRFL